MQKCSNWVTNCSLGLNSVWDCEYICMYVCVRTCQITEQRLKAWCAATSLIKRESLHCSGCRHHRQTSLITLSKCRFVQAISPLLFAYANMTDLIISFYISHTLIVIVKTAAWSQGQTHPVLLLSFPFSSGSIYRRLSTLIHATCFMRFCCSTSHVAECHGSIISQQMPLPDIVSVGEGKIIRPLPREG